jgi:hypothetical protein
MPNLIALQDQLKGLRDEDLDQELNQPSGAVPVFLVASEKQRRDQMRQAYEGEVARQEAGETTVLEDLLNARGTGVAPAPMGAPGPSFPPGAMGAPAPSGQPASGGIGDAVPGFANGGLIDYSTISTGYGGLADQLAKNREQNKWLSLAQIGAGIAGGTSPFFATNVGQGAQAGLQALQESTQGQTRDQLALMQAQLGMLATQDRLGLAQDRFTFEQEQAARDALADERRLELQERQATKGPAAVETFEYYKGLTPEEQAKFVEVQRTRAGRSAADFNTASTAYRRSVEFAEDKVKKENLKFMVIGTGNSVDTTLQNEYNARVREEAARRFIDFYPQFQEYLPMFGRGSSTMPAGAASGIKFVENVPEGASIKDLTTPIMRGGSSGPKPTLTIPENPIFAR